MGSQTPYPKAHPNRFPKPAVQLQSYFKFIPVMLPSTRPGSEAPAQGHLLNLNECTVLLPLPPPKAGRGIYVEGGAELMHE